MTREETVSIGFRLDLQFQGSEVSQWDLKFSCIISMTGAHTREPATLL